MAEQGWIENIIEKAVAQVLDSHVPRLREELVRQVLAEVQPQLQTVTPAAPVATESSAEDLLKCVSAIHAGSTQKEVLRALLDNTVHYSGRSALFVVRAGAASGWEARGFKDNTDIKDFPLDVTTDVVSNAMHSRVAATGTANEVDSRFASQFGTAADDHAIVVPLLLKEKVAALLYADPGDSGRLDAAALELLVKATGAWLEVAVLRKQSTKEMPTEAAEDTSHAVPVQAVSSFSDPFAGHAPLHTARPEMPVEAAAAPSAARAQVAVAEPPSAPQTAEDTDTHRKAQRFARLLVDEIKLYNQAKVTEGRKHKDLYDRLREDIEKSRSTYLKRYGNTAAASGDYFNSELVRSLAEDDVSIMGAGFRR